MSCLRVRMWSLAVGAALLTAGTSVFADDVYWVGGDGFWYDPANWSSNPALPGVGDDVIIDVDDGEITVTYDYDAGTTEINSLTCQENLILNGGSLSIQSESSVAGAFTLQAGTLGGSGDLTVAGLTTWNGGTILGVSGSEEYTADGGMAVGGVGTRYLDNRVLKFTGTLEWTNGAIQLLSNAQWNVASGCTFNAGADGLWLYGTAGSTFEIENGGNFVVNVTGPDHRLWIGGGMNVNNSGKLDVQAGTLLMGYTSTCTHTGADIDVAEGAVLEFWGGGHELDEDTTLDATHVRFTGTEVDLNGPYTLTGEGRQTESNGGTASFTGAVGNVGDLVVNNGGIVNFTGSIEGGVDDLSIYNGTVNFSHIQGTVTADTLTLTTYGTLTGTSDLTVTGLTTWNGGTISGISGDEEFNATGAMIVGGSGYKYLDHRVLNFTGTVEWTGGWIQLQNGAHWNVASDCTLNAEADGLELIGSGVGGTFEIESDEESAGEFVVNLPGSDSILRIKGDLLFSNSGRLDVQAGTLQMGAGSVCTHTSANINVAEGAVLDFWGGTHNLDQYTTLDASHVRVTSGTVELAGWLTLTGEDRRIESTGGTADFMDSSVVNGLRILEVSNGGIVNFTGSIAGDVDDVSIDIGVVNFSHTEATITADTLTLTDGTLTGTSDLTVSGVTTWDGGTISGLEGTEQFTANGAMNVGGTTYKNLDHRELHAFGTVTWTEGWIHFYNHAKWFVQEGGKFSAQATRLAGNGLFENHGDFTVEVADHLLVALWDAGAEEDGFDNEGGFVEVQSGELTVVSAPYDQSTGTTRLSGGKISSSEGMRLVGGLLEGDGLIDGHVVVHEASVAPGDSPGIITVGGDLMLNSGSTAEVEIGGLAPGTQHDQIRIDGNVGIAPGATLSIVLDPTHYTPTLGQQFTVMTYTSRTLGDHFTTVTGDSIPGPGGLHFRPVYTYYDLVLTVANTHPVTDCDDDGIPDECELDCGTIGGPCYVEGCGNSDDCNNNLTPDECDIRDCDGSVLCSDCNGNKTLDACEVGACCLAGTNCAETTGLLCWAAGGEFLGPCVECPSQSIAIIPEPGGGVFTHVIGPPVACPTGISTRASQRDCPPGALLIDPWVSPEDGSMCHNFGVPGSPPIPAGFFATGSAEFAGSVCLRGMPLGPTAFGEFGQADTLVARTEDPFDLCDLPSAGESTVAIEVVALSLESVAPIEVQVDGGDPQQWNVFVDLSDTLPPAGTLTATKSHCNGGTYTSLLNVQPRFTFTRVDDPGEVRVLDTGSYGISPVTLDQTEPAPWVAVIQDSLGASADVCSDFHAGIEHPDPLANCDCNTNAVHDECDQPGNVTGDGTVDLLDFPDLAMCFTGPCLWTGYPCQPPLYGDACCRITDFDKDGDVDLVDFSGFQEAFGRQ